MSRIPLLHRCDSYGISCKFLSSTEAKVLHCISTHFVLRIMPAVAAHHADCQSAVSSRSAAAEKGSLLHIFKFSNHHIFKSSHHPIFKLPNFQIKRLRPPPGNPYDTSYILHGYFMKTCPPFPAHSSLSGTLTPFQH